MLSAGTSVTVAFGKPSPISVIFSLLYLPHGPHSRPRCLITVVLSLGLLLSRTSFLKPSCLSHFCFLDDDVDDGNDDDENNTLVLVEHLLWARQRSKHLIYVNSFNPRHIPESKLLCYYPYLTDEETEA